MTDKGIVLSWTAPAGGADSYWIYRSWPRHSRGGFIVSYRPPGSATSFTDKDVAVPGGHYRYHIQAIRGGWGSGYSDLLTVVVPANAVPTATGTPVPSTATPTATPTSAPPGFQTPTPTATPANRGRRLSDGGAPELTATPTPTPASVLPVPKLTAQAGADAVELRWPEVSGAVRYELMVWWDAETGWQPIGGANLTGTSYTHTSVTAGTTYFYTIRAVNAAGETSGWLGAETNAYPSVIASQGVPAGGTSTATPTPTATAARLSTPALTATATAGGVALRWGAVQGAVRYELMVWWDPLPAWQPIGGANLTGTSYTHTNVTAGTTYFYTIRAVNAAGGTSGWLGAETNRYPSVTPR
ncbi:MAG: fibronectin type III domain-containing protein [Caldilineaceae bacterium SB0668_bin_21]|nr:fibronectin type III domain-containing protein [Caldilineaceae bacterium SB0668_bin_21]